MYRIFSRIYYPKSKLVHKIRKTDQRNLLNKTHNIQHSTSEVSSQIPYSREYLNFIYLLIVTFSHYKI